jgi:hypothetical protein
VDPPALLVEIGYGGEYYNGQTTHWELRRGCEEPVASGLRVEPGPGDLWIGYQGEYDENAYPVIFRGAARIGGLRHGNTVRFRPR